MLKSKKCWAVIVCYILLSVILGTMLVNIAPIKNRISNNKSFTLKENSVTFFDWKNDNLENIYISGKDPQITLNNLNCYVNDLRLYLDINMDNLTPQVFMKTSRDAEYAEENSMKVKVAEKNGYYTISIGKEVESIRIDLVDTENVEMNFNRIDVNSYTLGINMVEYMPYAIGLVMVLILLSKRSIFIEFWNNKAMIVSLAKNDLKSRYAGSILGIFWAYIQPIMTIVVMWFVFQVGFRNPPVENVEFILWFIAAYIPWMYFNDGVSSTTNALQEYSYLVKKIKFQIGILPVIKIMSSFIIHIFFMIFIFVMYSIYGHYPEIIWFQVIYYSFALTILLLGLSFLFSSLSVFLKDFSQVVGVILQLLFWFTPIVWSPDSMDGIALKVIKLNPLYYIVQGYRDTFINHIYLWEHPILSSYYWACTFVILILGVVVFKKLKPHFSDLL